MERSVESQTRGAQGEDCRTIVEADFVLELDPLASKL